MTQNAREIAERLIQLQVSPSVMSSTSRIFEVLPETLSELGDPTVSLEKRNTIIDSVFPTEVRDTLKLLCEQNALGSWKDIAQQYSEIRANAERQTQVRLRYVTKPTEKQLLNIQKFVFDKYKTQHFDFQMQEDKALGGGFILEVGNDQYDWSTSGRRNQFLEQLRNTRSSLTSDADILTILQKGISNFDLKAEKKEIGFIESVGDGIAIMNGLDHAMYGEVIEFDNGTKGMVQNIERNRIGVILFGDETGLGEGSRGMRTGRMAGVPVSNDYLGRVVNALGEPIDGLGPIHEDEYRAIEQPAPGIIDRQPVNEPLQTGILAIDSMFPIGRGQRELIIGDRQTGKTSIAMDTILNQADKNCICIYVAIGQKESTVASLVENLKKHDAMKYTCVMAATAADPAPIQYIAPYAATALAEYFMYKGQDVLIVYDDLSKHAVAYRALSLLLGRAPGREAYPGDVFYLHSRLLERSCRLSEKLGGGSITALPIIETQDGDVSAYIPTNVISITDGQIFLESNLFFEGQRPAVAQERIALQYRLLGQQPRGESRLAVLQHGNRHAAGRQAQRHAAPVDRRIALRAAHPLPRRRILEREQRFRRGGQRVFQHDAAVPAPPFRQQAQAQPKPRRRAQRRQRPPCRNADAPQRKKRVHGSSCFLFRVDGDSLPGEGGGYSEGGNPSVRCGGQLPPSHRPSSLSCAGVAHGLFYEKSILCSFLQNAHASGSLRSPCGYRGAKGTLRRGRGNNGKRERCRK